MHKPYKSEDILCKNTFSVKKVQPSKVEQIGDNIWYQNTAKVCHIKHIGSDIAKYYTGHGIASYCFQMLIGLTNLLSVISCYKFHILKD